MLSVQEMNQQSSIQLPGAFLHFIGVCEVLGGLGLVLPNLLRIRQGLTPLAAVGLLIIMIGATVITGTKMGVMSAVTPFVVNRGAQCEIAMATRSSTRPPRSLARSANECILS